MTSIRANSDTDLRRAVAITLLEAAESTGQVQKGTIGMLQREYLGKAAIEELLRKASAVRTTSARRIIRVTARRGRAYTCNSGGNPVQRNSGGRWLMSL
jgi:hypothetical protein